MTPELAFSVANLTAMLSWVLLVVLPRRRWVSDTVAGVGVPALLAAVYVVLVATNWGNSAGGFSITRQRRAAVREPVDAPRGVGALLVFRSPHRLLGGARRSRAGRTPPPCRSVPRGSPSCSDQPVGCSIGRSGRDTGGPASPREQPVYI